MRETRSEDDKKRPPLWCALLRVPRVQRVGCGRSDQAGGRDPAQDRADRRREERRRRPTRLPERNPRARAAAQILAGAATLPVSTSSRIRTAGRLIRLWTARAPWSGTSMASTTIRCSQPNAVNVSKRDARGRRARGAASGFDRPGDRSHSRSAALARRRALRHVRSRDGNGARSCRRRPLIR